MVNAVGMAQVSVPLPERMRPAALAEVVGQEHLVGADGVLTQLIAHGHLPSLLLWGPPGCGKTTIARLLANELGLRFAPFSAVLGGVAELRALIAEAQQMHGLGQGTLLLVDEIHRFSKSQQDALLPHVEAGTVTLVGATTENPSFSCNAALLSRCRVLQLHGLDGPALTALVARIAQHDDGLPGLALEQDAQSMLQRLAAGDGRRALLILEEVWAVRAGQMVRAQDIARVTASTLPSHDRAGDQHYDVASAFIKSMRASDVQAALYYLARQLEAGEDPRFVARRVVIFASEDVGLAEPNALLQATAAFQAVERIGMPEAVYPLSQAVIYCSTAPKSNTTKSYFRAAEAVRTQPGATVPLFLRNAPTELMADLGYTKGYVYDHDTPDHFAGQACLPEVLTDAIFYKPGKFGYEREIHKRLEWWQRKRREEIEDRDESDNG